MTSLVARVTWMRYTPTGRVLACGIRCCGGSYPGPSRALKAGCLSKLSLRNGRKQFKDTPLEGLVLMALAAE